jgi:hypothetical protein
MVTTSVRSVYAQSGFWDQEITNILGSSKYRVYYDIPDLISTNATETVNVTFVIVQLGGLTAGVRTDSIDFALSANDKAMKWTIVQEIVSFNSAGIWGPFVFPFKVLDSDFSLSPQQEVTATASITVNFDEVAAPFMTEYGHSTAKNDITVDLISTTKPTTIGYGKELLGLFGSLPFATLAIAITLVVTVTVSISIRIRRAAKIYPSLPMVSRPSVRMMDSAT